MEMDEGRNCMSVKIFDCFVASLHSLQETKKIMSSIHLSFWVKYVEQNSQI